MIIVLLPLLAYGQVTTSAPRNGWTKVGTDVYLLTSTDYVGIGTSDPNVPLQVNGVIRSSSSEWYHCLYMSALSVAPGASGATLTAPSANTLGGYQLNAASEYLYSSASVCSDWDNASDLNIVVTFEVNANNTGGNVADTVDLSLLTYYKGNAETANKTQTIENAVTIGASAQYKQFSTIFVIDYDKALNVVE